MRKQTYRMRVLSIVESAVLPLTGRDIAKQCGLAYKQVIDALNALYNHGKVSRIGRKMSSMWSRAQQPPQHNPLDALIISFS